MEPEGRPTMVARRGWLGACAVLWLLACGTKDKIDAAAVSGKKAADKAAELAQLIIDKLNEGADAVANAAKSPGTPGPSVSRPVPGNFRAPQEGASGQTGEISQDQNGDGKPESVTFFVSDDGTVYYSWSQQECDDPEDSSTCNDRCYVAWEDNNSTYYTVGVCGQDSYYACSESAGADAVCVECNASSGSCSEGGETEDAGPTDAGTEQDFESEGGETEDAGPTDAGTEQDFECDDGSVIPQSYVCD